MKKSASIHVLDMAISVIEYISTRLLNRTKPNLYSKDFQSNFKKNFDYFMKEEYPEDSNDLRLPSEDEKRIKKEKQFGRKLGQYAKQLKLFITGITKRNMLKLVLFSERVYLQATELFFSNAVEFENRLRE